MTGAIGQPGVFYLGAPAGGIWKTTNAGVSWFPIFDQFTNVDSIGAIQVAPSDANIVYAGTGDSVQGSLGDGMYKSIDAGKTWTHIGLEETTKINKMVVDPKDPNIVVVSTQGDARHNGQGIYRTTDGGKTWENTLRPENANGTRDVEYAFDMPNVIFATSQGAGGGFGGGGGGGAAARTERHRALQIDRLRQDVEEGRHAAAVQRPHQRRDRDAHRRPARLCDRHSAAGRLRSVSVRRPGRDVAAHGGR